MAAIDRLVDRIKAFGRNSTICDLAVQKVLRNPRFFLGLSKREENWAITAREIYQSFLASYEKIRQIKGGPFTREIHQIEREAFAEEAALIGKAVWTLNEEDGEAPAKVADLASKSKPKGFEGLNEANKITDLSMYYSNILTPKQRDCFSLKFEYELKVAEISRRLGITRPMIDKHLLAAKKKLKDSRIAEHLRRQAEKNKQHRD